LYDYLACRWLVADPARAQAMGSLEPPDASQALPHARAAFERAAAAAPEDVDLQTALGVIAHLSGDFRAATAAFERALATQPDEYSLWNKLGATLANSNRSGEAKSAYFRALQCKPGYMRAWTNLGISNGNLGQYRDAAQNYIKALTLNPRGEGVWGYLKTAVVLMGRMDLVGAVDAKDLGALANELGCAELRTALKAN
jgi:peroxin-5